MEKATDRIIVGELFEGTRDMFRDCFFDNATDEQIIDWSENEDEPYTITHEDGSVLTNVKNLRAIENHSHLRELYKEDTGYDCHAYIQKFAGDSLHEDGFSDEYVLWLEAKVDELTKKNQEK